MAIKESPSASIAAEESQIAKAVLMSGDPLRAKYVADHYLEEVVCFNTVRNMLGYTGTYKGKRISVMGHGMGVPSMGIYSYELYQFFGVDTIIRIGSAGGIGDDVKVRDVVIALGASTNSHFADQYRFPGQLCATADFRPLRDAGEAAEAESAALETEQAITALVGNINALPSIDKLTSSDGGNVKKLMEQYETLKQDDREKVTNSALLLAAFERITAIEKQMADVEAMIKEKLEGVTVNLDTKEDIQAIDKAMEGLASTDVAKITAVEQFLSPAKVDLVNLMLKELVEDGQTVTATQENKEALQALLDEINQYYTGIPEADKKYVEGYEAVATVQAAIDALEEKDSDLNGGKPAPETGDHLPTAALLLVLAAGSTLLINRKRK